MTINITGRLLICLIYAILLLSLCCLTWMPARLIKPLFRFRAASGVRPIVHSIFLLLIVATGFGICSNALFSSFTSIKISEKGVCLNYCWPRPNVFIANNQIKKIELIPFGNGNRVGVLVTASRAYQSQGLPKDRGEVLLKQILQSLGQKSDATLQP